jgi:hypothetical protein
MKSTARYDKTAVAAKFWLARESVTQFALYTALTQQTNKQTNKLPGH